ncbi:uncharacterized protein LOC106156621 [Lingula anatina]|uniref:Uncharacterized protein LOC106156621 n=1 Tax=Lingula anatina TaxID=7574 RepID=A0A1S3HMX1_LINAN|nr:uncharacterized protein LOC106156621 [Lingula anatina]|eukprot:XP_013387413.1 uncharacterized protein LOC106156621 [Lingula anatina]
MASATGIHSLLTIRLKNEITEDQLKLIKHCFTRKIGAGRIENMDTLDLLNELNNRMIISEGKYYKLRKVFKKVGLEKLNRQLDKAEKRIQEIKSGKANGKNEVKEDLSSSESDEDACAGSEEQTDESRSGDEMATGEKDPDKMAMTRDHVRLLKRHRCHLVDKISNESVKDILNFLEQEGIFTNREGEAVKTMSTKEEMVGKLLDILSGKSEKAYPLFRQSLENCCYGHLSEMLK